MKPKVTVPWVSLDFVVQRQTLQNSQVKAALVKSIEKPIEGTYDETKCSTSSCMELSQSLHHRTRWSLSHWCQASHQPGQVQRPTRACGKPSRIFQLTATSHCSKNSHNLGHQDLIVPTFLLYAHAKSAVLCHDLPMASQNIQPIDVMIKHLASAMDSHDSLVEHRWGCSKSTSNGFVRLYVTLHQ